MGEANGEHRLDVVRHAEEDRGPHLLRQHGRVVAVVVPAALFALLRRMDNPALLLTPAGYNLVVLLLAVVLWWRVADQLGIHVGTVSRAVAGKWMQTPRGMIALRRFFSGGTETDSGRDMSWEAIKATLQEIVDGEEKTLTRDQITSYAFSPDAGLRAASYAELLRVAETAMDGYVAYAKGADVMFLNGEDDVVERVVLRAGRKKLDATELDAALGDISGWRVENPHHCLSAHALTAPRFAEDRKGLVLGEGV